MKITTYRTSPEPSEAILKQKYIEESLSVENVGKKLSCSKLKIKRLLKKHNIPLREPHKGQKGSWNTYGKKKYKGQSVVHNLELRTIETIKKMYSEEGLSLKAIARLLDSMQIPTKKRGKGWHISVIVDILKREKVYKTDEENQ